MNSSVNFLWDSWSSDDSDEEFEETLAVERRQYYMYERLAHLNKWDDIDFFRRFRFRKQTVANILELIRPQLQSRSERNPKLTPMAKLLITFRFYALGTIRISVEDSFGVYKATCANIIHQVSCAIASLRKNFVKMPQSDEELFEASLAFYKIAKFPRTIGAIDCTHVKIQSPGGDKAEHFRNKKGFFSLNVQTVCSADLKFLNIVARWPGSCHDQIVFDNSLLKSQLERKDFKNYLLVADSGYCNTSYMATPLLKCKTAVEKLYNQSIIRSHNVVEKQYNAWKRRFPVLSLEMRIKKETIQALIVATTVLHNIAVDFHEEIPPDALEFVIPPLESIDLGRMGLNSSDNIRAQLLTSYFPTLLLQADRSQ